MGPKNTTAGSSEIRVAVGWKDLLEMKIWMT